MKIYSNCSKSEFFIFFSNDLWQLLNRKNRNQMDILVFWSFSSKMVLIFSFDICFIHDLPLPGSDWPNFLGFFCSCQVVEVHIKMLWLFSSFSWLLSFVNVYTTVVSSVFLYVFVAVCHFEHFLIYSIFFAMNLCHS